MIAALSQKILLPQTVEMVEALVAKRAILLVTELSLFKVLVEGDCLQVIQALNAPGKCLILYRHVIEDAYRIGSTLQSCSFHHVKREGNKFTTLLHIEQFYLQIQMYE